MEQTEIECIERQEIDCKHVIEVQEIECKLSTDRKLSVNYSRLALLTEKGLSDWEMGNWQTKWCNRLCYKTAAGFTNI